LKILKKLLITFQLTTLAFAGEIKKLEQEIVAEEARMQQESESFSQWKQSANQKIKMLSSKNISLKKEHDSLNVSLLRAQKNVNNLKKRAQSYSLKVDRAGRSMVSLMESLGAKLSDGRYSDFQNLISSLKEKAALGNLKGDEGFSQIWQSLIQEYQKSLEVEVYSGAFNLAEFENKESVYGKYLKFGGVLEVFVSENGERAFKKQYNEAKWQEEKSNVMKEHLISVLEVASGNTIPKLVLLPIQIFSDSIVKIEGVEK
jgi:predicted  nucleic acid-binding Zn-ribbon protein